MGGLTYSIWVEEVVMAILCTDGIRNCFVELEVIDVDLRDDGSAVHIRIDPSECNVVTLATSLPL